MNCSNMITFRHCGRTIYTCENDGPTTAGLPRRQSSRCPVCGDRLRLGLLDAPVRVHSPLRNGHLEPCCFLLAAQHGPAALTEWSDAELHVGISNSKGLVYSYTRSGVQRQQDGWENCVIVPLVAPDHGYLVVPGNHGRLSFKQNWDRELEMFSSQDRWTPERFSEEEFVSCCYGYALGFINKLLMSSGKEPIERDSFTCLHVLPRMRTASKYLSVCQHITQYGYYST